MKVTLFSSNQPRHLHLARELSRIADSVHFVSEVNTIFPGEVSDFFSKSDVMQAYFGHVIEAERKLFGDIGFLPGNVRILAMKSGDLARVSPSQLSDALESDVYVIFGSSYIKGWLVDFLLEREALNIHMGLSPYYLGSSCNFWALYDDNPAYVGATIHMLSKGLDSGDMLFHCVPQARPGDSLFDFTMRSVLIAHKGLVENLASGEILSMPRIRQDREREVRYTRNADFTDAVAQEFLERNMELQPEKLDYPELLNPIIL